MWRIHLRLNRNKNLRAVRSALRWCGRDGYQPVGLFSSHRPNAGVPRWAWKGLFWKILFCSDKSWWNYFNKSFSRCWAHLMLSFWILLLEQFLLLFLTFPESIGAGVRSSSVIWCVVCHAGMKRRSRAAERLLYCHMSPVVLAGTADAPCTLIRERGKAQPICHCALRRWLLKLLWRTVSKADSKNQTINNTLFLVGLFLKIISRLTQKEEPVCLWNIK